MPTVSWDGPLAHLWDEDEIVSIDITADIPEPPSFEPWDEGQVLWLFDNLTVTLEPNVGGVGGLPGSPSLDRFDPSRGYEVGNVAVISLRANIIKSDTTLAEMQALIQWLNRMETK